MEITNQEANRQDVRESYENGTKLGTMAAQLGSDTECCGNSLITLEKPSEVLGDSEKNIHTETNIAQNETETQISKDIFPSKAYTLITRDKDNPNLIILDVCTPKEFAKLHLENAINLNFFSRSFKDQLNALDKNKTYLIYCKVGGRSKVAQKMMKKLDFKEVYNIVGGTLLWAEEGLPFASGLERPPKFSLCPIFMSITLIRKLKKLFQSGYRLLVKVLPTAGLLRNNVRDPLSG